MYICLCNPFSHKDVEEYLAKNGDQRVSVGKVYRACSDGESPQCCSCIQTLKDMLPDQGEMEAA